MNISEKEILARFQLLQTKGIGAVSFRHILKVFGSAEKALDKLPAMVKAKRINIPCSKNAEEILQNLERTNQKICFYDSTEYPKNMRALDDLPPALFYSGKIESWPQKMIGVVGTRNASLPAIQFTHKLAQKLSEKGYGILSGMALGIDGASHQGALDGRGYTGAVLAGGVDQIYPLKNTKTYYEILEKEGVILSEHPPYTTPQASFFPSRNRIIAGGADLTLVIEAQAKSGSLITAEYAEKYNRPVGAVPGFPSDPRSGAPNKLIRENRAFIIETVEDIEKALIKRPMMSLFEIQENKEAFDFEESDLSLEDAVFSLLSKTPTGIQDIAKHLKVSENQIRYVLLVLELEEKIKFLPQENVIRL